MQREPAWAVFAHQAEPYDAWYDSPEGAALFGAERAALVPLVAGLPPPGLEVGVGTGRFAAALGFAYGLDPAVPALHVARRRGVQVVAGMAEALPFLSRSFGAVAFIVTLSFVADPLAALREARRVLRTGGGLVLADVPGDSPRGRHYAALGAAGHPYYRQARFRTRQELRDLCSAAGLRPLAVRCALPGPPGDGPADTAAYDGDREDAGFLALLAVPT